MSRRNKKIFKMLQRDMDKNVLYTFRLGIKMKETFFIYIPLFTKRKEKITRLVEQINTFHEFVAA